MPHRIDGRYVDDVLVSVDVRPWLIHARPIIAERVLEVDRPIEECLEIIQHLILF